MNMLSLSGSSVCLSESVGECDSVGVYLVKAPINHFLSPCWLPSQRAVTYCLYRVNFSLSSHSQPQHTSDIHQIIQNYPHILYSLLGTNKQFMLTISDTL